MRAIDKAIWYIENHFREDISLDTLATIAGVSKYHLSRMFCYAVGKPISRYLRLRRLSNAAIALAAGEPDILDLALSMGYGSHEAFSRAFKEYFGMTPEQVRQQAHTDNLHLVEAIQMQATEPEQLQEPRFEKAGQLRLVGISRHYTFDKLAEIPNQWQSFAPAIEHIAPDMNSVTYGVVYNPADESFDYLSGVELPAGAETPVNMYRLDISAQTYAIFKHPGHVANVRVTCDAIWSEWLPQSNVDVLEAPWFERYGLNFDPQTGEGGLEIWIPVVR